MFNLFTAMNQLTKTSDRWYLDNKSDMALSNKKVKDATG
jgi:hypothetical protein